MRDACVTASCINVRDNTALAKRRLGLMRGGRTALAEADAKVLQCAAFA